MLHPFSTSLARARPPSIPTLTVTATLLVTLSKVPRCDNNLPPKVETKSTSTRLEPAGLTRRASTTRPGQVGSRY